MNIYAISTLILAIHFFKNFNFEFDYCCSTTGLELKSYTKSNID